MPDILVVEDQRFFQQVFRTVLGKDFQLSIATTGLEGWQMYLQQAPDIVFLDIELPGINGHVLGESIQALDPHAFVVMVTASSDEESIDRALRANARGFVAKPYSKKKIFDYIGLFMSERDEHDMLDSLSS